MTHAPRAPAQPWQVVLAAALAAGVSQAFGRFAYSLLLADVQADFGLSSSVAGFLGSANLAAYLLGTFVVAMVIGRLGPSRVSRVSIVGVTIALGSLGWSPNVLTVLAALLVSGFFGAGVWVTAPGLAAAAVAPSHRGRAIGLVGSGIGLGMVIASILATLLGEVRWRTVYWSLTLIAVVAAILVWSWIGDGQFSPHPTRGLDAMRTVPDWHRLTGSYAAYGFGMALMVTFLVSVLEHDHQWAAGDSSLAFSALGGGTVIGGLLFGPLTDRAGPNTAIQVGFMLMIGTALVIQTGADPWAIVAGFVFGLAFTGVPTAVAARISAHVDAASFGAAFGVATLAFGAGLVAGPQVGGLIGDRTGSFRPVFGLAALAAVLGASLGWDRAPRRHQTHRQG